MQAMLFLLGFWSALDLLTVLLTQKSSCFPLSGACPLTARGALHANGLFQPVGPLQSGLVFHCKFAVVALTILLLLKLEPLRARL